MTALKVLDDEAARLDRGTFSAGCTGCPLRADCGGFTRSVPAWSCMDRCETCDKATCDLVCTNKPDRFLRDMMEVGGFQLKTSSSFAQPLSSSLSSYVPVLQHGKAFDGVLNLPIAAVPLSKIVRANGQVPFTSPEQLRAHFGVAPTTRLILLGTGKDRGIERYWHWRREQRLAEQLAKLDFVAGIAPNYSLFIDEPRPTHLHNRKRSLICAEDWSRAGLAAIPYLCAVTPTDWDTWYAFLVEHPEINVVAKEFQTGYANPRRGGLALVELDRLQQRLGRELHVVAIGGAHFARDLGVRFSAATVMDSQPFMKAVKRQDMQPRQASIRYEHTPCDDVTALMDHNIGAWDEHVSGRLMSPRALRASTAPLFDTHALLKPR